MRPPTSPLLIERHRTPVIMAVWKRIERLPRTLELLAEQDLPATLYVWNNNRREAERVDRMLARSPIPAQSFHCPRNIGCFGRFYLARELAGTHDAVLFIDDDQDFARSMVADQLGSFVPRSLAGWWAFTYRPGARSYAERDRVEAPLELADYVGVGGMVADASVFTDPGLFRCPRRYWFVDDVWLSYFASHIHGWTLRRSLAEFEFAPDDGLDIDLTLAATKKRMFRYLKRRGWSVAAPAG
jgi:peptidoglycan/xylan/chitin deacetylase (PgdA/CDA1 family)